MESHRDYNESRVFWEPALVLRKNYGSGFSCCSLRRNHSRRARSLACCNKTPCIAPCRWMVFRFFIAKRDPRMRRRFCCCTGCRRHRGMFEPLFARLSDRFHLIAPDYPGFGHSDAPDPKQFAYTFDHIATIMEHFTEKIGLTHYTLYMQDYGGPVGFRMILAHPERVDALIVQDAVAHDTGLGANWKTRRAFWADRADERSRAAQKPAVARNHALAPRRRRSEPRASRSGFVVRRIRVSQPSRRNRYSKRSFLRLPHQCRRPIPSWQAWMQKNQPRLLVIWGKYESSFDPVRARSRTAATCPRRKYTSSTARISPSTPPPNEIATLVANFMSTLTRRSASASP